MRLRHYRGAGVHSPFVYGIVRNCLMPCGGLSAERQIEAVFDYLGKHELYSGEALCVVSHRRNRRARRAMVEAHDGTSFETRKFLCVFTGEGLPKQHFRL